MNWAILGLALYAGGGIAAFFAGPDSPFAWAAVAELVLVAVVATWLDVEVAARRIVWLCAALSFALIWVPLWQVAALLALVAFRGVGSWRTELHVPETWSVGTVPPLTAIAGLVMPVALIGWFAVARPDLREVLELYVPPIPLPLLWLGAVGFAVVNAFAEELVWRGVFHRELRDLGGVRAAIGIGAVSFGLQHVSGVPRGALGVLMVAGWGVLLGVLRERSGGLVAPVLAHIAADLVIAWIVLVLVS